MSQPINPHWLRRLTLIAALAAVAYLVVVFWAGHAEVTAAMRMVDPRLWATLCGLSLLNYGLRFLRWHYSLERLGSKIPWNASLLLCRRLAFTTTPGKAGEGAGLDETVPCSSQPHCRGVSRRAHSGFHCHFAAGLPGAVVLSRRRDSAASGPASTAVALTVLLYPPCLVFGALGDPDCWTRAGILMRMTDIISRARRCPRQRPWRAGWRWDWRHDLHSAGVISC